MAPPVRKARADQLLVEQGLVKTRSAGQALILAGRVYTGDVRVEKAGTALPVSCALSLRETERFVSRGGIKLESALQALQISVSGLVVADIGASTGGFTDCVLQHGASHVYAIDVGAGLLAEKLRQDPRVNVLERTNARHLTRTSLPQPVDLVTVDASFIGIKLLLPGIAAILRPGGKLLAMVKPQFEVGKAAAKKARGVIRDEALREAALAAARVSLGEEGFEILAECDSGLRGPKGNLERFVFAALAPKEAR